MQMTQDQIRTLTARRRVQAFMHAAVEHPLLANTTVARRRLDRVVAQLTTHVADQSAATLVLRDAPPMTAEHPVPEGAGPAMGDD